MFTFVKIEAVVWRFQLSTQPVYSVFSDPKIREISSSPPNVPSNLDSTYDPAALAGSNVISVSVRPDVPRKTFPITTPYSWSANRSACASSVGSGYDFDKQTNSGTCPFCQKTFQKNLRRHIKGVHFNAKPYKCDNCPMAFIQNRDKVKHSLRKHKQGN